MNEWKNIDCMLYRADTPRLQSTTQNICFLISISVVILKLKVKVTSISFFLFCILMNFLFWNVLHFFYILTYEHGTRKEKNTKNGKEN